MIQQYEVCDICQKIPKRKFRRVGTAIICGLLCWIEYQKREWCRWEADEYRKSQSEKENQAAESERAKLHKVK